MSLSGVQTRKALFIAPAATKITLIGEFTNWSETDMYRIHNGSFWECTIANAIPGMMYKYRIYKRDGER